MRLFVGIPLPASVIGELTAISARYKSKEDGLRWTEPESWHITLQFLGNTVEEKYSSLVEHLRHVHSPPVPVRLEELGFFERAGAFIVGVKLTPELLSLEQRVSAATSQCGFVHESRPYHPHVTLARLRDSSSRQVADYLTERGHYRSSSFEVSRFVLFSSRSSVGGGPYVVEAAYPFEASELRRAQAR